MFIYLNQIAFGYLRAPFRFFFSPLVLVGDLLTRVTNSSTVSCCFSFLGLERAMVASLNVVNRYQCDYP